MNEEHLRYCLFSRKTGEAMVAPTFKTLDDVLAYMKRRWPEGNPYVQAKHITLERYRQKLRERLLG